MKALRSLIKKTYNILTPVSTPSKYQKIEKYLKEGRIPWSEGYTEYKWSTISEMINNPETIEAFRNNQLSSDYGIGLDERIVEYPWIISNLSNKNTNLLDAGSTLNYNIILLNSSISKKNLCIYTYNPEVENFNDRKISYMYGDLRNLAFRDEWFDEIVCQSTIEHIDMDNSIYGYSINNNSNQSERSYEYLKAIKELIRVLKSKGVLLLTFPYGKYENHKFFQQFYVQMLESIKTLFSESGEHQQVFFKYLRNGWQTAAQEQVENSESYNPHSGVGKFDDGAAHCRAVCCMKFLKR